MDGIDTSVNAKALGPVRGAGAGAATPAAAPVEAAPAAAAATATNSGANLISLLADAAPPIDTKTVEAIRSLIAQGRYPIDAHAIAAKMIALDKPA